MRKYFYSFITAFLILCGNLLSQSHPKDYFRNPVGIPIVLAGNFGELRPNHFHSGIDIKTRGVQGYRIYAAADGWVSRIKVSPWGYGNALYISHPNGYTTVYAHLREFKGEIAEYVKKAQYMNESFEIELFPGKGKLPVNKGDTVALSGNSGGSTAPHLHFEIRDTKTEKPINPLLFGFEVKDNIKPIIQSLTFYPLNDSSHINGKSWPQTISAKGSNGKYKLTSNSVAAYGEIGVGIEMLDRLNGASNRCGVYNAQLFVNDEKVYEHELERFSFYENRYMNAHMDYEIKSRKGKRIQRSFILPNNMLSIYKNLKNDGVITVSDSNTEGGYIIKDAYGNKSGIKFTLSAPEAPNQFKESKISPAFKDIFSYDKRNTFEHQGLFIDMPAKILYEDIAFEFTEVDAPSKAISKAYRIHNEHTPLHSYMTVSFELDSLDPATRKAALICSKTENGRVYAEGGNWAGNRISVKTRSFGTYYVTTDSVPPRIVPINISQGRNMKWRSAIIVSVTDNLSGIKTYRGTIDKKWVLMEYDPKNAKLSYDFEGKLEPGEHLFELTVTDGQGNVKTYQADFTR